MEWRREGALRHGHVGRQERFQLGTLEKYSHGADKRTGAGIHSRPSRKLSPSTYAGM